MTVQKTLPLDATQYRSYGFLICLERFDVIVVKGVFWFWRVWQIRETRKAVRDSEAGLEKMAVGRHMNDRGHVITRQKDTWTGDMEENQDYHNFDECEQPTFVYRVFGKEGAF